MLYTLPAWTERDPVISEIRILTYLSWIEESGRYRVYTRGQTTSPGTTSILTSYGTPSPPHGV
jgi:hypothetical protein